MSIDLETIRRKVAQLSGGGNRNTSRVNLWKPSTPKVGDAPKEFKVRLLPWKNAPEGSPFYERWFYYIGDGPGVLTLHQFGQPDPIQELISRLFRSGKAEDKAMAKKLLPKMRAYAPIIVRGEESEGIKVWSFGKMVYQRLLGFFIDAEVGDILDPKDGFDLKVTFKQQQGKQFLDTEVDAARRTSALSNDSKEIETLLAAVPDLNDMYRSKTYAEVESILNRWLNDGSAIDNGTDGTSKGGNSEDNAHASALEDVAAEITKIDEKTASAKTEKPAKKSPKKESTDPKPVEEFTSLDDAFEDLMK